MNTMHLRNLANRLRSIGECSVIVIEQLDEAAEEIDRLRASREVIARTERGEFWHWQGDGNDFPESLACPVVMDVRVLRDLLDKANKPREILGDRDEEI